MKIVTALILSFLFFAFTTDLSAQQKLESKDKRAPDVIDHILVPYTPSLADVINEGFEGGTFPPAGWTQVIQNTGYTWKLALTTPHSGTANMDIEYDPALVPQNEFMISPSFSLAGAGTANLSFWFNTSYYWHVSPYNNGNCWILITTNNGTSWDTLWREEDYGTFVNWTWYQVTLSLTPYAGQSNVKIAWNYVGSDGAQYKIDDIIVNVPCSVPEASNPVPANNEQNVPINLAQISWTNPPEATATRVYFGTDPANMTLVQSGSLATSYAIPSTLSYFTNYYWQVVEIGTCETPGPIWTFKTLQDPNLFFAVDDNFENGSGLWTITNDGGTCLWLVFMPPYPNTYTLPATSSGGVFAADADQCGSATTILSTATLTNGVNLSQYQTVMLEFDSDWQAIDADDQAIVDVSNDGGATWVNYLTYGVTDMRNEHLAIDVSVTAAQHDNVKIRFKTVQPGWDWWWAIDNVQLKGSNIIPVELVSFRAAVNGNSVTLNWMTATETNNSGFEVERSINNGAFVKIAMVTGHGTTSETQAYSFTDNKLANGTYAYRLKQVDYDGTFKYSTTVNTEVNAPKVYSLDQNYPNPFNPSTKISFTLASDSKVSLKVFNLLGQEVAVIAEGQMTAGSYNYTFDASKLNSGVYFYQIEAKGNDGSSFKSIKKMMLTK